MPRGSFAFHPTRRRGRRLGESSAAQWLAHEPAEISPQRAADLKLVKENQQPDCWSKWRGPEFGNNGRMTIRWAHDNVDGWLKKLNPEVTVIMFGTNDLGRVPKDEYCRTAPTWPPRSAGTGLRR